MKKPAAYLRISTNRQNPENQEAEIFDLCRSLKWGRPKLFTEQASRVKDRAVFASVLRRVLKGEFGALVVWSIDRMGANFYEVTDAFRALEAAAVPVASVKEPWVLDLCESPFRAVLIAITLSYADFEIRRTRERIFAGLATARRKGKQIGRPRTISGPALEHAVRLRKSGSSWTEIAAALARVGHWHPETKAAFSRGTLASAVNNYFSYEAKKGGPIAPNKSAGGAENPSKKATRKPVKSRRTKRA